MKGLCLPNDEQELENRQTLPPWGESSQKYQNRAHNSPVLALQSICLAKGSIAPRHWGTVLSIFSTFPANWFQTTVTLYFCVEKAYTWFKGYLKKENQGSFIWLLVSYAVPRNSEKKRQMWSLDFFCLLKC